jgi:hypothetical protein
MLGSIDCRATYPLQVRFADNNAQKKLKTQAARRRAVHTQSSPGYAQHDGVQNAHSGSYFPVVPPPPASQSVESKIDATSSSGVDGLTRLVDGMHVSTNNNRITTDY